MRRDPSDKNRASISNFGASVFRPFCNFCHRFYLFFLVRRGCPTSHYLCDTFSSNGQRYNQGNDDYAAYSPDNYPQGNVPPFCVFNQFVLPFCQKEVFSEKGHDAKFITLRRYLPKTAVAGGTLKELVPEISFRTRVTNVQTLLFTGILSAFFTFRQFFLHLRGSICPGPGVILFVGPTPLPRERDRVGIRWECLISSLKTFPTNGVVFFGARDFKGFSQILAIGAPVANSIHDFGIIGTRIAGSTAGQALRIYLLHSFFALEAPDATFAPLDRPGFTITMFVGVISGSYLLAGRRSYRRNRAKNRAKNRKPNQDITFHCQTANLCLSSPERHNSIFVQ